MTDNSLLDKDIDCLIQYEGEYAICNYGMATIHLPNGYGDLIIFLNQFDKFKKNSIRQKYSFNGQFEMGVFEDEEILSIPPLSQPSIKENIKSNIIPEFLCYFEYGSFTLRENPNFYDDKNPTNRLIFLTRGKEDLDTVN